MASRLDDLPRYSTRERELQADTYNQVRLALRRLGSPLRFSLPRLRSLVIVLEHDAWVCVDANLNDYPILAWLDFDAAGRTALHTPIPCKVYSYHAQAGLVEQQVLDQIRQVLAERLRTQISSRP